jgi:hypothetical protein
LADRGSARGAVTSTGAAMVIVGTISPKAAATAPARCPRPTSGATGASASVSGRNAAPLEPGTARPRSPRMRSSSAGRIASATNRDLPIPASPTTNTQPPRPWRAASSAAPSASTSCDRPTSTGHGMTTDRAVPAPDPGPGALATPKSSRAHSGAS